MLNQIEEAWKTDSKLPVEQDDESIGKYLDVEEPFYWWSEKKYP